MFQRLIFAANSLEDLPSIFRYELSNYLTSIFAYPLMTRQANESALADTIWSKLTPEVASKTVPRDLDIQYVLDGGALLHRVWPSVGSATFRDLWSLLSLCN